MLTTEQGCPSSLKKFPVSGEIKLFSFFRGAVFWLLAFAQAQYFDFTGVHVKPARLLSALR